MVATEKHETQQGSSTEDVSDERQPAYPFATVPVSHHSQQHHSQHEKHDRLRPLLQAQLVDQHLPHHH